MTVEDQIRYLQSKIASLEARLASSQSQADNPTTEGRLLGTPQPTVDPKGRKIWEAEWRGDYQVMMAYVPDNALIINGENVVVEADDKEGDEVTLSDGPWYLHAYKNKTTGNWEAELDQEPTGTREDEEAKYNIHICDIHEDGYIEKQYVVGSIVIGGAGSKFVGDDEEGASEEIDSSDGVIHLQGFKGEADGERTGNSGLEFLTVGAREGEDGEKIPPKAIIDVKGRATASGCGNTENWCCHSLKKDGNLLGHFLGCRDIDIIKEGGSGGGSASDVIGSDYIEVEDEEVETGEVDDDGNPITVTKRKVSAKIDTPNVVPSEDDDKHALLTNDTDQNVRSSKTFLSNGQPASSNRIIIDGPAAKLTTTSADGNKTVEIDAATGVETLTSGEKKIVLNPSSIPNAPNCVGTISVHFLKFKDKDGDEHTFHILSCDDIDLTQQGKLIADTKVTASADPGGMNTIKFIYTDGTYDEFKVMNGLNGSNGSQGSKGDTPEITSEVDGDYTYVYADGELIATLKNGHSPVVDAQRTGPKQTTIYVDGVPKAVINDGEDGSGGGDDLEEKEFITGISFNFEPVSGTNKQNLVAWVTKEKVKVVPVSTLPSEKVDVVSGIDKVDVVVKSTYNESGDYKFKNERKRIMVLETPSNAQGQDVFTTTPLSGENA